MADITITLNDNEQQVLVQLLDAAVRQGGVQAAQPVVHFVQKLEAAKASTTAPAQPSTLESPLA